MIEFITFVSNISKFYKHDKNSNLNFHIKSSNTLLVLLIFRVHITNITINNVFIYTYTYTYNLLILYFTKSL